jgi:two-component system sensor histidine kinase/response regulator
MDSGDNAGVLEVVNVLAVDDTPENLVALRTLLKRPGLNLIEASSGREALEALLAMDIGLALLDVNMPEMDGFELAELMRGSARTQNVPIIFMTASLPDSARMFQGYEAGAVDFLFKPIHPYLLLGKVEVFARLHRQQQKLASQLEQIRQAQNTSDLFLGVLGHDLRNPLSNIVANATLLEKRANDAVEAEKRARLIQRASFRMQRLIQQVLDFALARVKGGLPVSRIRLDLADLVQQLISELDPAAAARVRFEMNGDCHAFLDPDRMTQVLSNLVGNAVEHGGTEQPISLCLDGSERDAIRIRVQNEGVIPPRTLANLFSPFKPRDTSSQGLGLGLYIVDQIVAAHGGSIAVTSEPALGTVFDVRLPRGTL